MKIAAVLICSLLLVVVWLGFELNELSNNNEKFYKDREFHLDKINSLERKIKSLERDMKDLDEAFDRLCSSYVSLESQIENKKDQPKNPKSFKTGLVI